MDQKTGTKKMMTGSVVGDKMNKTIVVRVERKYKHPKFKKVVRRSRRYKAHDENNECQVGDVVSICETRPLSKDKRWRLREIITRSVRTQAENA